MPLKLLDGLGDRLPAVTVFLLRRLKGWKTVLPVMILHLVLLGIGVGVSYYEEQRAAGTVSFWLMLAAEVCPQLVYCFLFIPWAGVFSGVAGKPMLEKLDPLLLLTPLTDRQLATGSFLAGAISGLSAFGVAALIYAYLFALNLVTLNWVFLYPFLCYVFAMLASAAGMSLSVVPKTKSQGLLLFLVFFPAMMAVVFGVIDPNYREIFVKPLYYLFPMHFFTPLLASLVGCVAVMTFFPLAWKILDFNLARQRSFSWKLAATLIAYSLWALAMLALWFGLLMLL